MENKLSEVMKYESVLPHDFDGTFRFTNDSDEDFVGRWGSKEYIFPAHTTSPIIMTNQTPLEIQQIRKKFARDWAEREFFKSQQYGKLTSVEKNSDGSPRLNSMMAANAYNDNDLIPLIQRCLKPLPVASAAVRETPRVNLEEKLSRNEDGELNTTAIDQKISLKKKALEK